MRRWQRMFQAMVFVLIGLLIWLPMIQFFYPIEIEDYVRSEGVAPNVEKLINYHLRLWKHKRERGLAVASMRVSNAEWDFMGRTFLVWSMANLALRQPNQQKQWLLYMDRIIDETVQAEREKGMHFFLMGYSRSKPFVQQPARSQFLDGEIALMMGMRRLVQEHSGYREAMKQRVKIMAQRMEQSSLVSVESYPDESWTFCNTVSLVAIKISDVLDGGDHSALIRRWIRVAKRKLTDPKTGLLISAHTFHGKVLHGPEGSSIWMTAHNLRFLDEAYARDQYHRARRELGRSLLGFGYAREWPLSYPGERDIDSGVVIPVLGASPGSSGLALVGAAAFGDYPYLAKLLRSLYMAAFPEQHHDTLRFLASNQVGDAVMLYALVQGPILAKVRKLEKQKQRKSGKQA